MTKATVDSYALGSSRCVLFTETRGDGTQVVSGFIVTRVGVVGVYAHRRGVVSVETVYTFARGGREHRLTESRERPQTGMTIVAGRFARGIVAADINRRELGR